MLGLLPTMILLPEPSSLVDMSLTFLLPIHCHLGWSAIITDYLPKRKFPLVYPAVKGFLFFATLATTYGLYYFNTNDIGISAFVKRLWRANEKTDA